MSILVLNAGSSTLKFALFDDTARKELASGTFDWGTERPEFTVRRDGVEEQLEISSSAAERPVAFLLDALNTGRRLDLLETPIETVGHRVVHGGSRFQESARVDEHVCAEIRALSDLAPLHNPPALEVLQAARAAWPDAVHVAVFDTTFFTTLPRHRFLYPVPYEWFTQWGIRRFGFHGISHAYCSERAAEILGRPAAELRLVTCHLGNGCSATAVRGGRAVATTMGFTPLDGLMMGTRPGALDPGVLVHVLRERGLTVAEVEEALNRSSGLLGVSGVSADFRAVEAAAQEGHERARLALDMYASSIVAHVGALAATMAGLDALVFTAGVGENAVALRESVCRHLEFLGLEIDPESNARNEPDTDIATQASATRGLIVRTREELAIAREAVRVAHALDGEAS